MKSEIVSVCGNTKYHCVRLHRGEDLLKSIEELCKEKEINAGFVASGVGCISKGKIRDASGITIREINEDCEIVSLNGTVSAERCHIHIALSKEDKNLAVAVCPNCSTVYSVNKNYMNEKANGTFVTITKEDLKIITKVK